MRRGARGWAATATRTLRDFITAALRLICSTASEGRLRSLMAASTRSAVRAGSVASKLAEPETGADSGGVADSIGFSVSEFMPVQDQIQKPKSKATDRA